MKSAIELLDEYSDNLVGADTYGRERDRLIDEILTPEQKAAIEDIKTEFNEKIDALTERNVTISNTLKAYVIENGSTLNGQLHQVVYTKGRVSWDTKKLDGYAAAHPEILEFKTEGEPSASLRARRS